MGTFPCRRAGVRSGARYQISIDRVYLLDTNVISELRRARPHGGVLAWLEDVAERDLHVSAIALGELQAGIEALRGRDVARATDLEAWLDHLEANWNVMAVDGRVFRLWAKLMHNRPDHLYEDAMIAATARVHDLIVVTRNTRDFAGFDVRVLNPFETPPRGA